MESESFWVERAQTAEAKLATLKQAYEPAIERIQQFKSNFGIKESSNGLIDIDFDKFAENLGRESAMELRQIIETKYKRPRGRPRKNDRSG